LIKYVVNTPKGGVGKTTISTNLALMLAARQKRVWALDLAQGSIMSSMLSNSTVFQCGTCKIDTREGQQLPTNFPGARAFDYMVVDTDDYWEYLVDLLEQVNRGWRLVAPVPPDDELALDRVPGDLSILAAAAMSQGNNIPFKVVANKVTTSNQRQQLYEALEGTGIASRLSEYAVPLVEGHPRSFYQNSDFARALDGVLSELG
jgi:chromosome partitioning protein